MTITVLVADAQPLLSESLSVALGRCGDLVIVNERCSFGPDAIEAVKRHRPDVVVLDYWMAGIDGPHSSAEVLRELEGFKVIFLSWFLSNKPWFDPPGDIERVIAAGAVGFIPKHCRVDQVAEAIRRANEGEAPVLAEALRELIDRMRGRREHGSELLEQLARLTPREIEILQLLAQGTTVAEGAAALFISLSTFRTHVQRILHKTGTHSQRAAISTARNFGIIRD
ncbi:MAG TPA: response regulator transcription factor [Acidimicrobiales bacterium]|nr:response regulator transcription factor [Acidimicrobiales bacterium]